MDDALNAAITRLAEFRTSWEAGDRICEHSKLTTADIDEVLAQLGWSKGEPSNPVMREIRVEGE